MSEQSLSFDYVRDLVRRHLLRVVLLTALVGVLAVLVALELPPKFKANAVLNIPSSYFRNPLVSDLVAEVTDMRELNAQRESLLRLALDDEFLDRLAAQFNLYTPGRNRQIEREELLERIEYFSLSPTSFQIALTAPDPGRVFEMTRAVLEQMTFTLIEDRYQKLIRARDAIQTQVEFLSRALREANAASRSAFLEEELEKLNSNIETLRARYTEAHPELVRLNRQASTIRARLEALPRSPLSTVDEELIKAFVVPSSERPIQDIYNDLLKKLSHLNIVLEMEKDRENVSYLSVIEQPKVPTSPFFPNPLLFGAFGLLVGGALGIVQATYLELRRGKLLTPSGAAETLGVPLLGELPRLESKDEQLLLEGPTNPGTLLLPLHRGA